MRDLLYKLAEPGCSFNYAKIDDTIGKEHENKNIIEFYPLTNKAVSVSIIKNEICKTKNNIEVFVNYLYNDGMIHSQNEIRNICNFGLEELEECKTVKEAMVFVEEHLSEQFLLIGIPASNITLYQKENYLKYTFIRFLNCWKYVYKDGWKDKAKEVLECFNDTSKIVVHDKLLVPTLSYGSLECRDTGKWWDINWTDYPQKNSDNCLMMFNGGYNRINKDVTLKEQLNFIKEQFKKEFIENENER